MNASNYYKFQSQLALPFLETNSEYLEEIFEILSKKFGLTKKSSQKFIDLGSGEGSIVFFAGTRYLIRSTGIEIDDILINLSKERLKSLKKNKKHEKKVLRKIKFIEGDFFKVNLKKYQFIYIYSLPSMQAYLRHVLMTASPKAILISHKHEFTRFESLLQLEEKLNHGIKKDHLFTYFYSFLDSE